MFKNKKKQMVSENQKVIEVLVELPITRAFFGINDEKYQIGDNFKCDVITSMVEIAPNRIRFFDGDKILADLTNPTQIEYV